LGSTARISIASNIAYIIGSLINSKVMVDLKKKFDKYLFFRAISSTVAGQLVDNTVFMTLAFAFVLPPMAIVTMVIGGTIIETVYEIIVYPVTRFVIKKMKAPEGA